jgi:3-phenylpropionate/trans-cinnamate dioxygenase ferredoxin reductase subunit
MSAPPRTVIVGAGQCGYAVATTLRKLMPDMAITMFGEEPAVPYERPPLSKAVLTDAQAGAPFCLPAHEYEARGIAVRTGARVTAIDRDARRIVLADGATHDYDRLVLATGARPRRLDFDGAEHVQYLRTFADAERLRGRLVPGATVVCIGAGVIGLEIAASARALGVAAVVVEASGTVMGRGLPAPERDFLRGVHEAEGVRFVFGTTATTLRRQADGTFRITLSDGEEIGASAVVAGIGILRNDDLARESGLKVDRGILVDSAGATDDPAVYAAGEVAAFWHAGLGRVMRLESWYHAIDHAAVVARALAGGEAAYAPVPRYWSDQYKLNIQVVGEPSEASRVVLSGERAAHKYAAAYLGADGRVVCAVAVNDARGLRPFQKMIAERQTAPDDLLSAAVPIEPTH